MTVGVGFSTATAATTAVSVDQIRLEQVKADEAALVFDKFDYDTAYEVGMAMVKYAKDTKAPQSAFDIRRNGQILFHVSLKGSTVDNERWIDAKIANISRFFVSTEQSKLNYKMMMGADWLKAMPNGEGDGAKFWGMSDLEKMGLVGGGLPINVKDVGFVGTIVASGGPDATDHDLIVNVLKEYLKK